jgi:hypothetical protein
MSELIRDEVRIPTGFLKKTRMHAPHHLALSSSIVSALSGPDEGKDRVGREVCAAELLVRPSRP